MNSIEFSSEIRCLSLKLVHQANASHIGGALSMADLLAVLYCEILNIDPANPKALNRDRLFISKGHACTSLYAALGLKGFFPIDELLSYTKNGSIFISHVSHKVPGVEFSTGSLGHALPVACGVALSAKRQSKDHKVYVILSDGELDEGSNWEAILFAAHHKLDNLICIIDYNKIQSLGAVSDVLNLLPLKDKFEAFNWRTSEIDGHSHDEIKKALTNQVSSMPHCVIANTIKGKGVDFMEGNLLWHYKSPTEEQLKIALQQIE